MNYEELIDKIKRLYSLFKEKQKDAEDFKQYSDAIRLQGCVSTLELLLIYAGEDLNE